MTTDVHIIPQSGVSVQNAPGSLRVAVRTSPIYVAVAAVVLSPPTSGARSLDFSDPANSGYLVLLEDI